MERPWVSDTRLLTSKHQQSPPPRIACTGNGAALHDLRWRVLRSMAMDFAELQDVIERTYGDRDRARGVSATVAWLTEEIGELAQAVRKGTHEQRVHEFGDVVAWVATLANQQGVDLNEAIERFAQGCPKCGASPCTCPSVQSDE